MTLSISLLFPGFAMHRVDAGDGIQINAEVGGCGPPLLLLHGFPQTPAISYRIAPVLAARFAVVGADLRGHGDSSTSGGAGAEFGF